MSARLIKMPDGRLRYVDPDGQPHDPVTPVRAFPISSPDQGFSLLSADCH